MFKGIADILGHSLLTHHAPTRRQVLVFWMGSFQVEQDGPFLSFFGAYMKARLPDDDAFHFIYPTAAAAVPKRTFNRPEMCVRSSDIGVTLSDDLMATSDAKHDSKEREILVKNIQLIYNLTLAIAAA